MPFGINFGAGQSGTPSNSGGQGQGQGQGSQNLQGQQSGQPGQQSNQQGQSGQQGNGPQGGSQNNNATDYTAFVNDPWSEPTAGNGNGQQQQQPNAPQGAPQGSAPAARPDVQAQLQGLFQQSGITEQNFAITPEIQAKFADGDFSPISGMVAQAAQKAFIAGIQASHKMLENTQKTMRDEAKKSAGDVLRTNELRSQLQTAIPQAKDPKMAPILEGVMRNALDRGYPPAQAIEATKQYLEAVGKALGVGTQPKNPNIGDSYLNNSAVEKEVDFAAVLQGLDG